MLWNVYNWHQTVECCEECYKHLRIQLQITYFGFKVVSQFSLVNQDINWPKRQKSKYILKYQFSYFWVHCDPKCLWNWINSKWSQFLIFQPSFWVRMSLNTNCVLWSQQGSFQYTISWPGKLHLSLLAKITKSLAADISFWTPLSKLFSIPWGQLELALKISFNWQFEKS